MRPIVHPDALPLNVFARGDRCRCAHDRDQIAVATDFDPEDAEASLLAMERHTLHSTGQGFCGMRGRGRRCRGESRHRELTSLLRVAGPGTHADAVIEELDVLCSWEDAHSESLLHT